MQLGWYARLQNTLLPDRQFRRHHPCEQKEIRGGGCMRPEGIFFSVDAKMLKDVDVWQLCVR